MRTTIRLDDDLLAEVKQLASESNRTMTAVIEDALRQMLTRQPRSPARPPVHLTTMGDSKLMPGVDLDNSAALLDLMAAGDGVP